MESLITGMPANGIRYTAIVPGGGPFLDRLRFAGLNVKSMPLESWRWWVSSRRERWKFFLTLPLQFVSLVRWIWVLWVEKADLVHFNINRLVEPVVAARLLRIPSVMHFRDIPSRMSLQFVLGRHCFYRLMNLPDRWIANSNATRADIGPYARRPINVVSNALDLNEFDRRATETICGWRPKEFAVAMIGGLTPWKNQADYLRVARAVLALRQDVEFLVVGAGSDDYTRSLHNLTRELGIVDHVTFLGFVANVPALLAAIDVLVHTMPSESFGRVFVEAMAARKPVVAIADGGAVEIVRDGETGILVPAGAIEEMADAVSRLLDDADQRLRMGEAGRQRVEENYSLSRHCAAIAGIYETVVAGCHR